MIKANIKKYKMTHRDTYESYKLRKPESKGVTSKIKKHPQKNSGIEIRLTFDIFINIDPNQFQNNSWNHDSL